MTQAPLDKADIRLLTEIGFLGAGAGLPRTVEKLFRAMMVIRPRRAFAYIGLATTHLNQSDPAQALQVMQQGERMLGTVEPHASDDAHLSWPVSAGQSAHLRSKASVATRPGITPTSPCLALGAWFIGAAH
jgi:hypothetical protein